MVISLQKSSGGYQSGTLHQQLYNALHPIKERMQAMRLLEVARDGTVVVVLYKPLLVRRHELNKC